MVLENRAAPYSTKDDMDGRVHYNDFLFTVEEKLKAYLGLGNEQPY